MVNTDKLSGLSFEIGPIRPPSEGASYSLLIRATRNCSWNRCTFCNGLSYGRARFELRSVEEVSKDIDVAKAISEGIKAISWELGYGGSINTSVATAIMGSQPELGANPCFVTVFNWLASGARTAFLQDADTLIMPSEKLIEVVRYLKTTFPSIERVTSYARAKTIFRKSLEELTAINRAGLSRLHVGLESGDDELLKWVDKGVTAQQHIDAGRKAKQAGFELSVYIMPDLGGQARSEQHARNTARVLNQIDPHFIRMRPFLPRLGTPLYREYEIGSIQLSSPHQRLRELRTLIEALDITGRICFDHILNSWYRESGVTLFKLDYDGYKFPEEKAHLLELIEQGLRIDESRHVHARDMIGASNL